MQGQPTPPRRNVEPENLANLVNEAWLKMSDRGVGAPLDDNEEEGFTWMVTAIELACGLMRFDLRDGYLAMGRALDLMEPGARRFFVAQAIHELASLGYRVPVADDEDEEDE